MVVERAKGHCEYCLCPDSHSCSPFSVEHIYPLVLGGLSKLENLAYSCQGCNNHKYIFIEALDTVSGLKVPLYHPRKDKWVEHFAWSSDLVYLVGLTATGRATIETLHLNRDRVLNIRKLLKTVGLHPPAVMNE